MSEKLPEDVVRRLFKPGAAAREAMDKKYAEELARRQTEEVEKQLKEMAEKGITPGQLVVNDQGVLRPYTTSGSWAIVVQNSWDNTWGEDPAAINSPYPEGTDPDPDHHMIQYAVVSLDAIEVPHAEYKTDRELYKLAGLEDGLKYPVRRINYCLTCRAYTCNNGVPVLYNCPAVRRFLKEHNAREGALPKVEGGFDAPGSGGTTRNAANFINLTARLTRRPVPPALLKSIKSTEVLPLPEPFTAKDFTPKKK